MEQKGDIELDSEMESDEDQTFLEESNLIYIDNLTKHPSLIYKVIIINGKEKILKVFIGNVKN
ncbi:unnamed protein product, partial [Brachionus calyciflorus]